MKEIILLFTFLLLLLMITITCKISPTELQKAMQIMARNNRSLLLITFLGYMQIVIGVVLLAKDWIPLHMLSTSGIFFITTGVLFAFGPSLITRLKVNQLLQTDNAFTEEITYNFSPHSYEAIAQTYRLNGEWKNIFQIKEAGGFLFIYVNKQTAMIISKGSFTPAQFSNFKYIIKREQGLSYRFVKDKK